jgi:hypothetical protein
MDLVAALRSKISELEEGEYTPGLEAVLLHVETAFRHFSRGQESDDKTAFTDAIYRDNQAFEGSIKEAYRVLAGGDPSGKRPFDIETYLEKKNIFRSRVLKQFTTYRTEWRNPSTHDYKLDFDESEAFLATVSVTAFSCLLIDQIAERLSYLKAEQIAKETGELQTHLSRTGTTNGLANRVVEAIRAFYVLEAPRVFTGERPRESEYIGALHGFLASVLPDLTIVAEAILPGMMEYRADLLLTHGDRHLILEMGFAVDRNKLRLDVDRLAGYMGSSGITESVLCYVPTRPEKLTVARVRVPKGTIDVLSPKSVEFD